MTGEDETNHTNLAIAYPVVNHSIASTVGLGIIKKKIFFDTMSILILFFLKPSVLKQIQMTTKIHCCYSTKPIFRISGASNQDVPQIKFVGFLSFATTSMANMLHFTAF